MDEQLVSDVERALWMAEMEESAALMVPSGDLLRELAKLGYAVVKLPDMVANPDGFATWPVEQKPWGGAVWKRQTDGRLDVNGVETPFNDPQEALSLAAALIAAARYV